ncbi:MAG: proton-translocating transhydrogenase family protein [Mariprofundales bacterium]
MTTTIVTDAAQQVAQAADPFVFQFTVFVLAIFVGFQVVWNVTPALHTPLMSVTNAISGIIIVGAIIASGPLTMNFATVLGLVAVGVVSINIFGGFLVTQRMLAMFKKREGKK